MSAAATLAEHIEPLRSDPAHSAILLDVDGVLAPIVRHADDAHVPEPTRAPMAWQASSTRLSPWRAQSSVSSASLPG